MDYERGANETRAAQDRDYTEDDEQQGGAIQVDPNHQLQSDGSPQPMRDAVKLPVTESRGSFATHKDDAPTSSRSSSTTTVANDKGRPWRALNVHRIRDGIQNEKPPIASSTTKKKTTEATIDSNEKNRLRRERNAHQFFGRKKAGSPTRSSNKNNAGDENEKNRLWRERNAKKLGNRKSPMPSMSVSRAATYVASLVDKEKSSTAADADMREKNRLRRECNAQAIRFSKKNTPSSGISSTTKETSNDGRNATPSNKAKHSTDEDLNEKRRLRRDQHALKLRQGNETTSPTIAGASEYGTNEADAVGTLDAQPPAVKSDRDLGFSEPNADETPGAFAVQGPGSESRSWSHIFGRRRNGDETNQQILQEDANLVIVETVDAEAVIHATSVSSEENRSNEGSI